MAEWSIAAVLKTVELRGSGGSNPSLSATWNMEIVRKSLGFKTSWRFLFSTRSQRANQGSLLSILALF